LERGGDAATLAVAMPMQGPDNLTTRRITFPIQHYGYKSVATPTQSLSISSFEEGEMDEDIQ
jgi:hypothetical protein